MKSLFAAFLETIVLFAAIGLVFPGARFLKYESPYNDFKEKHPDTVITVSSAIGAVPDGTILSPVFKDSEKNMLFRIAYNCSLIAAVMMQDAAGEEVRYGYSQPL